MLASEASVNGGPGLGLVDMDKRIHITTHDQVAPPEHCQKNLRWFNTAEEKIRVVGKVSVRGDQLQDFEQLMGEEVLYFASTNLKLEYSMWAVYSQFGKMFGDSQSECADIHQLSISSQPDSTKCLTFARGETLYSLQW